MRCLIRYIFLAFLISAPSIGAEPVSEGQKSERAAEVIEALDKPLYNPFVERYVLDELKLLRQEMAQQKVELTEKIVDRDLSIGDRALSYSNVTVTYFFYLIAGVSSILVIVGWTSIRDVRDKVHRVADKEVQKLVETYEKRLRAIELQLTQKTQHIDENRHQIEQTQEVHALWLRAAQENSSSAKIALYDEILKLRPDDAEALTYKADAVLELGEPQWAKSLCIHAVDADVTYVHAHYQLACANTALGFHDEALSNLRKVLELNESMLDDILTDDALAALRQSDSYENLIAHYRDHKPV